MTIPEAAPIACALGPGEYKERLDWIAALARDALRGHMRRDLTLELRYAREAAGRVREMVRQEQACCPFLMFDLCEEPEEIRLTISAPEEARCAADALFEHFVAGAPSDVACGCGGTPPNPIGNPTATKAASLTAMTLATGAVACVACCVLPLALPAVVLAGIGSVLALVANAHSWATTLAMTALVGAWGWIGWETLRTRCRPAASTLYLMAAATILSVVAVLWPAIEPQLVQALVG
jgi:hypothetical protein